MSESITSPTLRIRISHTSTLKAGWGYESTVEYTLPLNHPEAQHIERDLRGWLIMAQEIGQEEADARNRREGRDT